MILLLPDTCVKIARNPFQKGKVCVYAMTEADLLAFCEEGATDTGAPVWAWVETITYRHLMKLISKRVWRITYDQFVPQHRQRAAIYRRVDMMLSERMSPDYGDEPPADAVLSDEDALRIAEHFDPRGDGDGS